MDSSQGEYSCTGGGTGRCNWINKSVVGLHTPAQHLPALLGQSGANHVSGHSNRNFRVIQQPATSLSRPRLLQAADHARVTSCTAVDQYDCRRHGRRRRERRQPFPAARARVGCSAGDACCERWVVLWRRWRRRWTRMPRAYLHRPHARAQECTPTSSPARTSRSKAASRRYRYRYTREGRGLEMFKSDACMQDHT